MKTFENYSSYTGKEALTSVRLYFGGQEYCDPGHSFGPAVRKHYLIHFIEKGSGIYSVGNTSFQLQAGEAFLIYPDTLTYYQADKLDPWNYSWLAFDGHEASYILERCGFSKEHPICTIHQAEICFQEIAGLIESLADAKTNEFSVLASLFRVFSYLYLENTLPQDTHVQEYVAKTLSYLNHNYEYPIKLGAVASYIGIDRTYLYRVFHNEIGMSPQEYLLKIRIEAGEKLLKTTSMSVTEIALSCGFRDSSSFCRSFRKKSGISPLEYRKG